MKSQLSKNLHLQIHLKSDSTRPLKIIKSLRMKRLLSIFILAFCVNSCDDGEFEIQSFDFSDVAANQCIGAGGSFFIYYTNQKEALFLQIPKTNFPNTITQPGAPRIVSINTTNKVIYRVYSGNVSSTDICSAIPPVSPLPVEEWNAVSGAIKIETFVNKQTNETTGQSFITGYTHTITLINTSFIKADGNEQLFQELFLGDFVTSANPPTINQSAPVLKCGSNLNYVFKNTDDQVITLKTDAALFINSETPVDQPRTVLIGEQNTAAAYKVYAYTIPQPENFFCVLPEPSNTLPPLVETWTGDNGVSNVSGIIEVTTEYIFDTATQMNVYRHTIRLRKVTFSKSDTWFTFGNLYELGYIDTPA